MGSSGSRHRTSQEKRKMLISAAILLLGCSSALADGHANNMGCCEYKLVPGSMPKSGHYFLDTQPSDIIPDFCKDSCVYVKERMPGDDPLPEGSRFCFKPSSTYTSECQDTGDGGVEIDRSSVINGGVAIDSSSVIDGGIAIDSSSVVDSTESKPSDSPGIEMDSPEMKPDSQGGEDHGSMEGHGNAKCFTENVKNIVGVGYTIENIKTSEAGSWEFVFDNVFSETLIGITVLDDWSCTGGKNLAEGVEGEMKCTNEQKEYPAGTYSVKFSSDTCMTGTPGDYVPWREGETPLIKTFKVGDKDYCEGDDGHNDMANHDGKK